jgi:alkylhydroperoxidase family enzyme
MSVIEYSAPNSPAAADTVQAIRARRGGDLLNLDRMLLHSPNFARGWNDLLGAVRTELSLPPRLRELLICAVGVLNGAEYEIQQHGAPYLQAGGSAEALRALAGGPAAWEQSGLFDATERAALGLTLAMTRSIHVTPCLIHRVRSLIGSDQQLVEMVGVIATYNMVSRFLVALGVDMEEGF